MIKLKLIISIPFVYYNFNLSNKLMKINNNILTGYEFNQKYCRHTFIKLTNESENHNGFQFQDGLNICEDIYFVEDNDFKHYDNKEMKYIRKVIIPNDARLSILDSNRLKFITDKIILGQREEINRYKYRSEE